MKIRSMVFSFAIFMSLITLVISSWEGVSEGYDVQEENLQDGQTIFQKLKGLNLIKGINVLSAGITQVVSLGSGLDILGGLALVASGALQTIGGIVLFPLQIFGFITGFYGDIFPAEVGILAGFFAVIAVGFILLSAKLGFEL